jgi:hypothetical protein
LLAVQPLAELAGEILCLITDQGLAPTVVGGDSGYGYVVMSGVSVMGVAFEFRLLGPVEGTADPGQIALARR